MSDLIRFENVMLGYRRKPVLENLNFAIGENEFFGIVGANGSGKTTLLKLLTGEIEPDEGEVTRAKTLSGTVIDQQRSLLSPEKRVRDVLADGGDWVLIFNSRMGNSGCSGSSFCKPPCSLV
jgi:ATP-binding cassette subfamily F protein uup